MRELSGQSDRAKSGEKLALYLTFICKDKSIQDQLVRINVIQIDKGLDFFPGVHPADLQCTGKKGSDSRKKLMWYLKTLQKFNVFVEALINVSRKEVGTKKNSDSLVTFTMSEKTRLKNLCQF